MPFFTYAGLAATLEIEWLKTFHVSEPMIARAKELNTPVDLIQKMMTPHLTAEQEHIIYWLNQLDNATPAEGKKIRIALRKLGFKVSDHKN